MENKVLYRDKYTKEQFKEKIENTCYHGDYGFELELKEDYDEDNPYYYEVKLCGDYLADKIGFKEYLFLSYEDDNYLMLDHDTGTFEIKNDECYFALFSSKLSHFISRELRTLENISKFINSEMKDIKSNPEKEESSFHLGRLDTFQRIKMCLGEYVTVIGD